jgi:hypothetical protein
LACKVIWDMVEISHAQLTFSTKKIRRSSELQVGELI